MPRLINPAPVSRFQKGDRVVERLPVGAHVFSSRHPQAKDLGRYATKPRTGSVVAVRQKLSSNGRRLLYIDVLWDGRRSPSTHAINRLSRLSA